MRKINVIEYKGKKEEMKSVSIYSFFHFPFGWAFNKRFPSHTHNLDGALLATQIYHLMPDSLIPNSHLWILILRFVVNHTHEQWRWDLEAFSATSHYHLSDGVRALESVSKLTHLNDVCRCVRRLDLDPSKASLSSEFLAPNTKCFTPLQLKPILSISLFYPSISVWIIYPARRDCLIFYSSPSTEARR